MYQAIVTKYFAASNVRGSRIKATCSAGSITISYPHELAFDKAHIEAARQLAAKMDWKGKWVGGGASNSSGFTFVLISGNGFEI